MKSALRAPNGDIAVILVPEHHQAHKELCKDKQNRERLFLFKTLNCFNCLHVQRFWLSEHFWQNIFQGAPWSHTITLPSENWFQNSKSLHLYQSLCAGNGIWFGSCLGQSCRFTTAATRARRENDCRAKFCALITIWRMHKRREAWVARRFSNFLSKDNNLWSDVRNRG